MLTYKFSPWIEWLCISISTKYWQVTYSYLAKKVSGILDIIFLIIIHIQELGFKGLGFRQSRIWVSLQRVRRALQFHILSLLRFSLSASPHYCPFTLQDNFVAMKLLNFWLLCFCITTYKAFIFLVYVCSFRVVSFLAYVCKSRISKVLLMLVAPKLPVSYLCMQL